MASPALSADESPLSRDIRSYNVYQQRWLTATTRSTLRTFHDSFICWSLATFVGLSSHMNMLYYFATSYRTKTSVWHPSNIFKPFSITWSLAHQVIALFSRSLLLLCGSIHWPWTNILLGKTPNLSLDRTCRYHHHSSLTIIIRKLQCD